MRRASYAIAAAVLAAACLGVVAHAQQATPPPFATHQGRRHRQRLRLPVRQPPIHVRRDLGGVIATDPIGYGRPQAVVTYVDEIRKITNQPIKYLIYSHHHFDHIAGGKPFKDAGATIVALKRTQERLAQIKDPHTVMPDEVFDGHRTITLGDTTIELTFTGLNHSDNSVVMRLPKQRVLFAVDFIPVGSFPGRAMIDSYPLEWEDSLKSVLSMDWDKLIPGHPGAPNGRLGTKQDVQSVLTVLQDASAAVKAEAQAGKCWDAVEKDLKLPKYETWPGYAQGLPMVLRRYCGLWGRGT